MSEKSVNSYDVHLGHNLKTNLKIVLIKLQAMQDAPPLQLYPASDKFLM